MSEYELNLFEFVLVMVVVILFYYILLVLYLRSWGCECADVNVWADRFRVRDVR